MLDRNNGIHNFNTSQYISEIIVESFNESRSLQGSYAEMLGLTGENNLSISNKSFNKLNTSSPYVFLPFTVRNTIKINK